MKRDHAGLCSYNPKNAKASAGSVAGIKRPRSPGTGSDSSFKKDVDRWPRTTGTPRFTRIPDVIGYTHGVPRCLDQSRVSSQLRTPYPAPLPRDSNPLFTKSRVSPNE